MLQSLNKVSKLNCSREIAYGKSVSIRRHRRKSRKRQGAQLTGLEERGMEMVKAAVEVRHLREMEEKVRYWEKLLREKIMEEERPIREMEEKVKECEKIMRKHVKEEERCIRDMEEKSREQERMLRAKAKEAERGMREMAEEVKRGKRWRCRKRRKG
ncbi:hypothetical protein AALO_G00198100 [Alosa alosa]|uniref:Uncharacterized protein n=1 Tax=Alosa alosa TaxID=278164 RepID=A0AAV6G6I4_9TELE|nr:hypothetical protein AALO_G00198100 [Alosa alosa]